MAKILYEEYSERDDEGVLSITEGIPFTLPIVFEITDAIGNDIPIQKEDVVKLVVKEDSRKQNVIFEKEYTKIINNVILFKVTDDDIDIFKAGCKYIMGITQYSFTGKIIRKLMSPLCIKVNRMV